LDVNAVLSMIVGILTKLYQMQCLSGTVVLSTLIIMIPNYEGGM
jgi:hypothetical protein